MLRLQFFFLLFIPGFVKSQSETVLKWQFLHPDKHIWIDAGTHGSVQETFIQNGELPDPFYGKNEELFNWIEHYTWEFVSYVEVTASMIQNHHLELEFPCVDTYAKIYVNDSLIGSTQNAFLPYWFDVKGVLKEGKNTIKTVFTPPILYHRKNYDNASYHLPAPNDVNKEIAVAPYTRKPQYQFGWDWTMRMNTLGFLKPVKLLSYDNTKISTVQFDTESLTEYAASMKFTLCLTHPATEKLTWKSRLFGSVEVVPGTTITVRNEQVNNPVLWWPRGQGEQHLYTDEWQLIREDGKVIERRSVRFGIRKTELIMKSDQWGTSYVIQFNGRPVFCKGADYIPQEVFPSKVTDSALRSMVETMSASNFNMIRIWGGGYYPDEAFFDACDELGIMVWQDFMFACAMYPGDEHFLNNVRNELNFQIPRLASHPSLTLFNGNNEVDVAWKNWGFQIQYKLTGKAVTEIEQAYNQLFKQLTPEAVSHFTHVPYVHTSPLSNWGKDDYYNHGSQHYWGVWHGKDPLNDFATKIGRFNAEYGFQSFPEYSTLRSFSEKSEWNLDSDVMKHHQKSYVGNGMILKHAKTLYGTPPNFEEFVYFSQLTQATAVGMAVTGHRLDAPRCMGTLYWQLNDCWPAPSWSSIDYFGNWKALQYTIKKDYEDVAILRKVDAAGQYDYFLISDLPDTFTCNVVCDLYSLSGTKINTFTITNKLSGNQHLKINISENLSNMTDSNYILYFKWNNAVNQEKYRVYSEIRRTYSKAELTDFKIELIEVDATQKRAKLRFHTTKYVRNCWFTSDVQGVHFNENFEDYLPGIHDVMFEYEQLPDIKDISIHWM